MYVLVGFVPSRCSSFFMFTVKLFNLSQPCRFAALGHNADNMRFRSATQLPSLELRPQATARPGPHPFRQEVHKTGQNTIFHMMNILN